MQEVERSGIILTSGITRCEQELPVPLAICLLNGLWCSPSLHVCFLKFCLYFLSIPYTRHVHMVSFNLIACDFSQLYSLGKYKIKEPLQSHTARWVVDPRFKCEFVLGWSHCYFLLSSAAFSLPRYMWNLMKCLWRCPKWICLSHSLNACLFSLSFHFPWV